MKSRLALLLGFDSIHDVLRAEKAMRHANIPCDMIPTPRDLSANCGMSIECNPADRGRIESLQAQNLLDIRLWMDR